MKSLRDKIKLLAIDLDETLVRADNTVSDYTKSIIQRVQQEGIRVVIATGRMYQTAQPIGTVLDIGDIPMILFSGGAIQTIHSGEILWEHRLPLEAMQQVYAITREKGWYVQSYVDDRLLCHHKTWQSDLYEKQTGARAEFIGDELYTLPREANKLIIIDRPEQIETIQDYFTKHFGQMVSIVHSQANFLEIIALGVSKGNALKHLSEQWDIAIEEMVMFGNSENDISMLSLPGHAVAVDNAEDSVKAVADEICDSNEDDGVARWIEKYILEG